MKKLVLAALSVIFATSISMAQPPQGGNGEGRPEQQTVEQRVEQMKKSLDLTPKQCEQFTKLFEESEKEMKAMRESGERPDREKMQEQRKVQTEKIKKILTEEQYEKYEKMMSRQNQRRPQQGERPE